ncbi:DegT/DnrJ/EryC1/StrS family aminotransferase [bacterium]|nr:DegT/DnrJ/EryC1/StrS family aminotransferase [bacterium]
MVNLRAQYLSIKDEIDEAISRVLDSSIFINGPEVQKFEAALAEYLGVKHVIGVANGTDALQIAFMALGYEEGDEVITPSFTYAATAEILGLLKLTPVFVDVDPNTYNLDPRKIEKSISARTKAIIPVHLYGSPAPMEDIISISNKYGLHIIEDNAQGIGAEYHFENGSIKKTGAIGDLGTFSFFPSKNLGCYGDGGAVCTNDDKLAQKVRMIAKHGQSKKYIHDMLGCNSRLDAIQAAILNVKLNHLERWNYTRLNAAKFYNELLADLEQVECPIIDENHKQVFHQYTIKAENRDELQAYLQSEGIPSVVYYKIPLHKQKAFINIPNRKGELSDTEALCDKVLSLPIDSEIAEDQQIEIVNHIKNFYKQ